VANLAYVEDAPRDDYARRKYIASCTTFSGSEGAVIGYASNAPMITSGTIISTAAMVYEHIVGAVVVLSAQPTEQQYDPEFVRKIREADAKPPVAKFTNVVDMMEWLDRD
jgi:hypothetical protein